MEYIVPYMGKASGTIAPASFIKGDPSNPNKYLQAGLGDMPLAITPNASKFVPGTPGISSFPYAESGDPVFGFVANMLTELQCGTAWTPYQLLTADASGFGKPAGLGDWVGALSFTSASAGEVPRVVPLQPFILGNSGGSGVSVAPAGSLALTSAHNGAHIYVNSVSAVITAPLGVVGYRFLVVNGPTAIGSGTGTTIAMNAADALAGNGYTPLAGKGSINTQATAVSGDYLEIECVATNLWYITRKQGTWARVA